MSFFKTPITLLGVEEEITLRLANIEDAKNISQYFHKNRGYLKQWDPKREEGFYTEMGWKKKLIKLSELHKHKLAFYCLVTDSKTDEMLGTISFSNLSKFPFYACNVGYSLDENQQGCGTMSRALKMACDWMFTQHNVHRVMAAYMPHNKKSEKVLQRNGFELEGKAKNYLLIDGEWRDHNLTSLINPNWKEVPNE